MVQIFVTHLIVHGGNFVINLSRWAPGVVEAEHWRRWSASNHLQQEALRQATVAAGLADHLQEGVVVELAISRRIRRFYRAGKRKKKRHPKREEN